MKGREYVEMAMDATGGAWSGEDPFGGGIVEDPISWGLDQLEDNITILGETDGLCFIELVQQAPNLWRDRHSELSRLKTILRMTGLHQMHLHGIFE